MRIETILVGVAGTEGGRAAVRYAAQEVLRESRCPVIVLPPAEVGARAGLAH